MFSSRTNWRLDSNPFARALEAHRQSGKQLFDLTVSNPTECGLTYPEEEIRAALADPRMLVYQPESKGSRGAREAIANYYLGREGFSGSPAHVDPERILLTSGTSEGYNHIFRLLCEPGDEVLVPAPSYPLLEFIASLADVRLVPYPLRYDHVWEIDMASLRSSLSKRSRAVVVVHPNNPTGSFVKQSEAHELSRICAERELGIVADEVFLDYARESAPAQTFAANDAALTFALSGISKVSLLPQMKLAWIVVSGPEAKTETAVERLEIIADTYLSPSVPVQLAVPQFLGFRHRMQEQLQRRIAENENALDKALRAARSVTRLKRDGGWYAILRVPSTIGDEALAITILERFSVLVHPGHFFNCAEDGTLVVSLIAPQERFREGVRRMLELFVE
jgi:alanine-synthesizing transaminase